MEQPPPSLAQPNLFAFTPSTDSVYPDRRPTETPQRTQTPKLTTQTSIDQLLRDSAQQVASSRGINFFSASPTNGADQESHDLKLLLRAVRAANDLQQSRALAALATPGASAPGVSPHPAPYDTTHLTFANQALSGALQTLARTPYLTKLIRWGDNVGPGWSGGRETTGMTAKQVHSLLNASKSTDLSDELARLHDTMLLQSDADAGGAHRIVEEIAHAALQGLYLKDGSHPGNDRRAANLAALQAAMHFAALDQHTGSLANMDPTRRSKLIQNAFDVMTTLDDTSSDTQLLKTLLHSLGASASSQLELADQTTTWGPAQARVFKQSFAGGDSDTASTLTPEELESAFAHPSSAWLAPAQEALHAAKESPVRTVEQVVNIGLPAAQIAMGNLSAIPLLLQRLGLGSMFDSVLGIKHKRNPEPATPSEAGAATQTPDNSQTTGTTIIQPNPSVSTTHSPFAPPPQTSTEQPHEQISFDPRTHHLPLVTFTPPSRFYSSSLRTAQQQAEHNRSMHALNGNPVHVVVALPNAVINQRIAQLRQVCPAPTLWVTGQEGALAMSSFDRLLETAQRSDGLVRAYKHKHYALLFREEHAYDARMLVDSCLAAYAPAILAKDVPTASLAAAVSGKTAAQAAFERTLAPVTIFSDLSCDVLPWLDLHEQPRNLLPLPMIAVLLGALATWSQVPEYEALEDADCPEEYLLTVQAGHWMSKKKKVTHAHVERLVYDEHSQTNKDVGGSRREVSWEMVAIDLPALDLAMLRELAMSKADALTAGNLKGLLIVHNAVHAPTLRINKSSSRRVIEYEFTMTVRTADQKQFVIRRTILYHTPEAEDQTKRHLTLLADFFTSEFDMQKEAEAVRGTTQLSAEYATHLTRNEFLATAMVIIKHRDGHYHTTQLKSICDGEYHADRNSFVPLAIADAFSAGPFKPPAEKWIDEKLAPLLEKFKAKLANAEKEIDRPYEPYELRAPKQLLPPKQQETQLQKHARRTERETWTVVAGGAVFAAQPTPTISPESLALFVAISSLIPTDSDIRRADGAASSTGSFQVLDHLDELDDAPALQAALPTAPASTLDHPATTEQPEVVQTFSQLAKLHQMQPRQKRLFLAGTLSDCIMSDNKYCLEDGSTAPICTWPAFDSARALGAVPTVKRTKERPSDWPDLPCWCLAYRMKPDFIPSSFGSTEAWLHLYVSVDSKATISALLASMDIEPQSKVSIDPQSDVRMRHATGRTTIADVFMFGPPSQVARLAWVGGLGGMIPPYVETDPRTPVVPEQIARAVAESVLMPPEPEWPDYDVLAGAGPNQQAFYAEVAKNVDLCLVNDKEDTYRVAARRVSIPRPLVQPGLDGTDSTVNYGPRSDNHILVMEEGNMGSTSSALHIYTARFRAELPTATVITFATTNLASELNTELQTNGLYAGALVRGMGRAGGELAAAMFARPQQRNTPWPVAMWLIQHAFEYAISSDLIVPDFDCSSVNLLGRMPPAPLASPNVYGTACRPDGCYIQPNPAGGGSSFNTELTWCTSTDAVALHAYGPTMFDRSDRACCIIPPGDVPAAIWVPQVLQYCFQPFLNLGGMYTTSDGTHDFNGVQVDFATLGMHMPRGLTFSHLCWATLSARITRLIFLITTSEDIWPLGPNGTPQPAAAFPAGYTPPRLLDWDGSVAVTFTPASYISSPAIVPLLAPALLRQTQTINIAQWQDLWRTSVTMGMSAEDVKLAVEFTAAMQIDRLEKSMAQLGPKAFAPTCVVEWMADMGLPVTRANWNVMNTPPGTPYMSMAGAAPGAPGTELGINADAMQWFEAMQRSVGFFNFPFAAPYETAQRTGVYPHNAAGGVFTQSAEQRVFGAMPNWTVAASLQIAFAAGLITPPNGALEAPTPPRSFDTMSRAVTNSAIIWNNKCGAVLVHTSCAPWVQMDLVNDTVYQVYQVQRALADQWLFEQWAPLGIRPDPSTPVLTPTSGSLHSVDFYMHIGQQAYYNWALTFNWLSTKSSLRSVVLEQQMPDGSAMAIELESALCNDWTTAQQYPVYRLIHADSDLPQRPLRSVSYAKMELTMHLARDRANYVFAAGSSPMRNKGTNATWVAPYDGQLLLAPARAFSVANAFYRDAMIPPPFWCAVLAFAWAEPAMASEPLKWLKDPRADGLWFTGISQSPYFYSPFQGAFSPQTLAITMPAWRIFCLVGDCETIMGHYLDELPSAAQQAKRQVYQPTAMSANPLTVMMLPAPTPASKVLDQPPPAIAQREAAPSQPLLQQPQGAAVEGGPGAIALPGALRAAAGLAGE